MNQTKMLPGKMHIDEAKADGYIVDEYCNPPIAYVGPRFNPEKFCECFTSLETRFIRSSAFRSLSYSEDFDERKLVSEVVRSEILGRSNLKAKTKV